MVIGGDCVCTLWFLHLMLLGVCCDASVPSRVSVLRSPLELIIMPLLGWQHFPSLSLAGSQTWVSSTTRGRRLTFVWQPPLPHSMDREQGWDHLRANQGFGEFWFIPPLLMLAYLTPTSFIWRIFSCLSGVGLAWVQCGIDDRTHRLEGVRTENSAGRFLVRNHLHSQYSHTDAV